MYKPNPEDTSKIKLPKEIENLTEMIAKNTHENWAKSKIEEGWVLGEEIDDKLLTHPCLIEYEKLSEKDKEYDRVTAMETIKFIIKKGYKITRGDYL